MSTFGRVLSVGTLSRARAYSQYSKFLPELRLNSQLVIAPTSTTNRREPASQATTLPRVLYVAKIYDGVDYPLSGYEGYGCMYRATKTTARDCGLPEHSLGPLGIHCATLFRLVDFLRRNRRARPSPMRALDPHDLARKWRDPDRPAGGAI